jgi:hypothetical protein
MHYRFQIPDVCSGISLVAGVVLCTAIYASTQQSNIAVTDVSGMGSPATLFGTMVTTDDEPLPFRHTLKKNISFTNLSSKSILLIISKINVSGLTNTDDQQTKIDECFFGDHVFNFGSTEVLEDSSTRFGESTGDTKEEEEPTATAEVVFVQFVDGSTWGNREAGKGAVDERRLTIERLRVLAHTYRAASHKQFTNELARPNAILILQRIYAKNSDLQAVIARINHMLHYAEIHERGMSRADATLGYFVPYQSAGGDGMGA